MHFRLRTLLMVLAVMPPLLAIPYLIIQNLLDSYDLWHIPTRYHELEEHLIERGIAKRGPDEDLRVTREHAHSRGWLLPNDP